MKEKDIDKIIQQFTNNHSSEDLLKLTDMLNDIMVASGDKSALVLKAHRNINESINNIIQKYVLPHKLRDEELQNIVNFFKNTEKMCRDFEEFLDGRC